MENVKVMMMTLMMCLMTMVSFGQKQEIDLDKVFESEETKDILYAKSKMFISERFKSAKDVIQLDDKENGIILLKGITTVPLNVQLVGRVAYSFSFTMKIYIKDNRYRVVISDVYNTSAPYQWNTILINNYRGSYKDNISKKKYWELMESLSKSINDFSISFENYMNREFVINDDW